MNKSEVKAVCLDYYGTLVTVGDPFLRIQEWFSHTLSGRLDKKQLNRFNRRFTHNRVCRLSGNFMRGIDVLAESFLETAAQFGLAVEEGAFRRYAASLFAESTLYADTRDAVSRLMKRYPVCLLTNADNDVLFRSLERHGLSFDYLVSSETARCNKPDHAIFGYASDRMGLPPGAVLMVGDSITEDVLPARGFGMQALWLNRRGKAGLSGIGEIGSLSELADSLLSE